ncbi:MAG: MFS transporter, partial [Pseudomonadota bacterium]
AFAVRLPAWATPERLILAGAAGGLIRWSWMGLQPDFMTAFALQLLHGLSFAATFLGTVRLVERDAPPEERAAAFAFQAALATGAFTGVIGLVAGPLYDAAGVRGYWAMAGLCAFATFIAILMTRRSASNFPVLAR